MSKAYLHLRVEIWHVDWALGDGSGTLGSAPPQAPGAGGGLTSPRGITAARPPFSFCNLWRGLWDSSISAMLAVLNVLGQLLGPSQGVLLPLGAVLGASWDLLGHSWGGLRGSWGPLGPSWRRSQTTKKYDAKQARFWTLKRPIASRL